MVDTFSTINDEILANTPISTAETPKEEQIITKISPIEQVVNEVGFRLPVGQKKPTAEEIESVFDEESFKTATNSSSSVYKYIEHQEDDLPGIANKNNSPKSDELEIIEGIGPKIAILLNDSSIFTFRDLAITPVYKIQEILENAGPQFARQDPSTWTQQAKLAAEGRWNELDKLKLHLIGGREPKKEENVETPSQVNTLPDAKVTIFSPESELLRAEEPKSVALVTEEIEETIPSFTNAPLIPIENNLDSVTEEMLQKVNKVKAAIRKAMVEKNDSPSKDNTPLPTLNNVIAKNENTSVSSFFDNL